MLYIENGRLGNLSTIGLGCWNFGAQWNNKVSTEEAVKIIRYAIDNGVNYVESQKHMEILKDSVNRYWGKLLKMVIEIKCF